MTKIVSVDGFTEDGQPMVEIIFDDKPTKVLTRTVYEGLVYANSATPDELAQAVLDYRQPSDPPVDAAQEQRDRSNPQGEGKVEPAG